MKLIPLSKGRAHAMVDDTDYEWLSKTTWQLHSCGYAFRVKGKSQERSYMHRVILNAPKGKEVDHIDANRLNNQRSNLRLCEHWQNQCNQLKPKANNTSGFTGVCFDKKSNTWYAQITRNNKVRTVGCWFKTIEEAVECRRKHAAENYGEFAAP